VSIMIRNRLKDLPPIPIHLIGHSAGGFVVTRIANRLTELGIVSNDPSMLHVTILDTPEPDKEVYEELPKHWPTDFYLTSFNVQPYPFRKVRELAERIRGEHQDTGRPVLRPIELKERDLQNVCDTKGDPPGFWLRISRKIPIIRGSERFWLAHRAAACWFRRTIEDQKAEPRDEGFNRSPVLTQFQRSSSR
jgi:pimeloyl-ACP methyl ester carboxylesterase